MKRLELGVFLPIAKNGFIKSTNAPAYVPSYRDNLEISQLAEEIGLDYVFSMLKWRGFGGATQFWNSSFDSFSLMAALAAATTRVDLIATVNPILHHPASMAKMSSTIQDVSGGRLGLNLITGSTLGEYSQMGNLPADYDTKRYAYAAEWIQVLKRLWSETSVTHDGEYFHLADCVSEPKPKPRPFLVCAGTSDEGLRFTVREADYAFVGGVGAEGLKKVSKRAHELSAEAGTAVKTATPTVIMLSETKAAAQAHWDYLMEGADLEANINNAEAYTASGRARNQQQGAEIAAQPRRISSQNPIIGGPQDVADSLTEIANEGQIDNICVVFPDYMEGLRQFGRHVMPILKERFEIGTGEVREARQKAAALA